MFALESSMLVANRRTSYECRIDDVVRALLRALSLATNGEVQLEVVLAGE